MTDKGHSSKEYDPAFSYSCSVLGGLSFILLLMVGVSFSLSTRIKIIEKPVEKIVEVPVPTSMLERPMSSEEVFDGVDEAASETPRTVDEMLAEAGTVSQDPSTLVEHPALIEQKALPEENPDDFMPLMTEEVAKLLKEVRSAQIDGDLKIAILKLEQALTLEPENPVVLYYYGLTYQSLRNAEKSREYFLRVYAMREKAGKYATRAAKHLQTGFSGAADVRGDMAFGMIQETRDNECVDGERVKLTVPIFMKDGLNVRPEDIRIQIQFFDKVNDKKVELTRAPEPTISWLTDPIDWSDGEEIMEVTYYMPPLSDEEIIAFGSLKYYGYTAKLYYKGEPMDCRAKPLVLFLLEQMNHKANPALQDIYNTDLLPPIEAEPVSDSYDELLPP